MKRKVQLFAVLFGLFVSAIAQHQPGDIAFIGFNADGNDNFSFVILKDMAANDTIRFCDTEWNGSAFVTGEGDFKWVNNIITPKGTVIILNDVDGVISANIGTAFGKSGISSSNEAIFAYTGTINRVPIVFLAAISNNGTAGFGSLENTGLTSGKTAIEIKKSADIAKYVGPRSSLNAEGYLSALNDLTNWITQDASGDQHNDGIEPDLPFDNTIFTFTTVDSTAPKVVSAIVLNDHQLEIEFSEKINETDANQLSNYSLLPALNISSVAYNDTTKKVVLTTDLLPVGDSLKISIEGIHNLAGKPMEETYQSEPFYFNNTTNGLYITEIMYNGPGDLSDNLEFIEIFNASGKALKMGGLRITDHGNFNFTVPQMALENGGFLLLATDTATANAFYGKKFHPLTESVSNNLSNGGESVSVINTENTKIFTVTYDDATPWPVNADGKGPSMVLTNVTKDANDGINWYAPTDLAGVSSGINVFANPGIFIAQNSPKLSIEKAFATYRENSVKGSFKIILSDVNEKEIKVDLKLASTIGNAIQGTDYHFKDTTLIFAPASSTPQTVNFDIIKNSSSNLTSFFAVELVNPVNADLGTINQSVAYLVDTDSETYNTSDELGISFLTSYKVENSGGSAEIVAFDSISQRLFVINSTKTILEILDFSKPEAITKIKSIDMSAYGAGATSVSVYSGFVAATVDGSANNQKGKVVFFDTDGTFLKSVEVGYLPDMLTFSNDGKMVLVANEGEPNSDYTIDPEGSVSFIDLNKGISNLVQTDVTDINFSNFNSQIDQLKAKGVRIFGLNATVAQDIEPEYITINKNNTRAYVTLQENNAWAEIDLVSKSVTSIHSFGLKDLSIKNNSLDFSDKTDTVMFSVFPHLKGMYMPDAIQSYEAGGNLYLVTANEGDQREWGPIDEDKAIKDLNLDSKIFPNAALLKNDKILGRLNASPYSGDTDGDGDFDEIHTFGARSFSIWNAANGEQVFDSGDDFERITASHPVTKTFFNASNSGASYKNRSDNKGPEPEGVCIANIKDKMYAFVGLERIGGFMTYDITEPENAVFIDYHNNRTTTGGDYGPEGIIYINPSESPIDTALIVIANEISATLSVFKLKNVVKNLTPVKEIMLKDALVLYPNPVTGNTLYFSKPVAYKVYNLMGVKVLEGEKSAFADISPLPEGAYIFKTNDAELKFIKKR